MKCGAIVFSLLALVASMPASSQSGQQSLAATLNVYAFPNAGQGAQQQSKDEGECYQWAVGNTGVDPFELQKQAAQDAQQAQQAQQQASQTARGSGARGALRGAAAGALIGEIADDDAGKGAGYGAAVGFAGGRMRGRSAQHQAEQQAAAQGQQMQQATEAQMGNFRKAFSACLEAKQYLVKF
jgi:hypothetical protein